MPKLNINRGERWPYYYVTDVIVGPESSTDATVELSEQNYKALIADVEASIRLQSALGLLWGKAHADQLDLDL